MKCHLPLTSQMKVLSHLPYSYFCSSVCLISLRLDRNYGFMDLLANELWANHASALLLLSVFLSYNSTPWWQSSLRWSILISWMVVILLHKRWIICLKFFQPNWNCSSYFYLASLIVVVQSFLVFLLSGFSFFIF